MTLTVSREGISNITKITIPICFSFVTCSSTCVSSFEIQAQWTSSILSFCVPEVDGSECGGEPTPDVLKQYSPFTSRSSIIRTCNRHHRIRSTIVLRIDHHHFKFIYLTILCQISFLQIVKFHFSINLYFRFYFPSSKYSLSIRTNRSVSIKFSPERATFRLEKLDEFYEFRFASRSVTRAYHVSGTIEEAWQSRRRVA